MVMDLHIMSVLSWIYLVAILIAMAMIAYRLFDKLRRSKKIGLQYALDIIWDVMLFDFGIGAIAHLFQVTF